MTLKSFLVAFWATVFLVNAHAGWEYRSTKDEMRGTTTSSAVVDSDNTVAFDFPYQGGSTAYLMVLRRGSGSTNIMLHVDKGQFVCFMDCEASVKFDGGPIQTYSASTPDDGSSNALFLDPEKKFLSNLLKSKRVIIEAPFYEAGRRQFRFTTEGLKWPPSSSNKSAN